MADAKKDKLQIRNSTVDFLVFTKDAHEDGIEVRVQDHDVWLTQKAIAQLFDVDRSVVTKHLKNVYESGELSEDATCANFAQVADNGKTYHYKFYSLPAIIAVGYRINSGRATQFRQWATKVLDTFTKQGYVLDKPTIYWDFHSLLLGVQMMFSFLLVDGEKPLRLCKHCQKVFLSSRSNSAFCSPRCKNQYNVYKSRGKKTSEED